MADDWPIAYCIRKTRTSAVADKPRESIDLLWRINTHRKLIFSAHFIGTHTHTHCNLIINDGGLFSKSMTLIVCDVYAELTTFKLTIGKIFACRLIAHNWRLASTRSNSLPHAVDQRSQVCVSNELKGCL